MRWILLRSFLFSFLFNLFMTAHAQAGISFTEFESLRQIFLTEYGPEIEAQNGKLFINNPPPNSPEDFWWNIPTERAAYATYIDGASTRMHYITVMGGYGQLPFMTVDTVAATMCHELGHGIGGEPYKDNGETARSSTEGQADYFSYRECLPRILRHYETAGTNTAVSPLADSLCRQAYTNSNDLKYCTRAFHSLETEKKYLKHNKNTETSYGTPDRSVVREINVEPDFYPSPQCRLDTMMAAVLAKPRPACWYKSSL